MDFSKVKLIVTDMDGTLLNDQHEVSDCFFELHRKMQEKRILFVAASGRQYYSLMNRMDPIRDQLTYIAENGAIVMEKGEQVFIRPMDKNLVHQVIKKVKKIGGKYLVLCGKKQAYIESTEPEFMEPFRNHYEKYKVVDDLLNVDDDVLLKLTICDLSGAEKHSLPHIQQFKEELQVKLSGQIWIDFTDKRANKGNALKALQEIHHLKPENTMAFGDYLNDIELFDHSSFSYAVDNAHPEVKKAARFRTRSNNDNGVEAIIKKVLEEHK